MNKDCQPSSPFPFSKLAALLALGLSPALPAGAATVTHWNYATDHTDSYWRTAANWTNGVPNATDSVAVFDDTSNVTTGTSTTTSSLQILANYSIGAIELADTNTIDRSIFNYHTSTTHTLTLNGVSETIDGEPVNLLLGNWSASNNLYFYISASTQVFSLTLANSGVIHVENANAMIQVGTPIYEGTTPVSITKTGAGVLYLISRTTNFPTGNPRNETTGGLIVKDGIVRSSLSSGVESGIMVRSPLGKGTVTMAGGALDTTLSSATFHNAFILDGAATFGSAAYSNPITISSAGGNAALLVSDSTITTIANTSFTQNISGDYSLTKAGPAYLQISAGATAAYTGATTVSEGSFWLNGTLISSPVTVLSGAIFGGGGSALSNITVQGGGEFAPGALSTRATLATYGAISLASDATLSFDLDSLASFDALTVSGSIDLGGANLQLSLGYQPGLGDTFVLIDNFGLETITGLLSLNGVTLNDGDIFHVTTGSYSQDFQIDYDYTNGSYTDTLAITAVVPEPSSWAMLGLGTVALATFSRRLRRLRGLSGPRSRESRVRI